MFPSKKALASFLNVDTNEIESRLMLLHSVLNIPDDLDIPVRILHLSFRDFLLDPEKKGTNLLWIDENDTHAFIFRRCLKVMKCSLRKNICKLDSYGTQRHEVGDDRINKYLPLDVRYACRYWVKHLIQMQNPATELDKVLEFLKVHFLHWVEAMGMLGHVSEVLTAHDTLQSIVQVLFARQIGRARNLLKVLYRTTKFPTT